MDRIFAKLTLPFYQAYWRIWKPETTRVRVVLIHKDQVLLVKHIQKTYWNIPSGKVERGETLAGALFRELKEELGITNGVLIRQLGVYRHKTRTRSDTVHVFVVQVPTKQPITIQWEISDARWFSLTHLPQGVVSGARGRIKEYQEGATIIGGLW